MATIFHLSMAADWAEAQASGSYMVSTRGRTLAEQGFIHASRGDQWPRVREAIYADVTDPMVLLQIDTDRLAVPVVEEPGEPGGTETFPHIYGPLPVAAVVKAIPLDSGASARAPEPVPSPATEPVAPPAQEPAPAAAPRPQGSFTQAYFREMFTNAAILVLIVAFGLIGYWIGHVVHRGGGVPGITGLVGLVFGLAVAVVIHRRRR